MREVGSTRDGERRTGWLERLVSSAVYTTDDRGRRVEVHAIVDYEGLGGEEIDPEAYESQVASDPWKKDDGIARRAWKWCIGFLVPLGAILAFVAGVLWVGWTVSRFLAWLVGMPDWGGPILTIGVMLFVVRVYRATLGRRARRRELRYRLPGMLCHGVCAGCGYGLSRVRKEADGCSVCPECGAAWKVEVWKRDFPPCYEIDPGDAVQYKERSRLHATGLAMNRDWESLREELRRSASAWFWSLQRADLARLALLAAVTAPVVLAAGTALPGVIGVLVGVDALVLVLVVVERRSSARRWAAEDLGETLIARGVCRQCEQALRSEPRSHDGLWVCTKCGVAWEKPGEVRMHSRCA